jgi:hypothetical protein
LGGVNKARKIVTRKINEAVGINKVLRSISNRFMAKATGLSVAIRKDLRKDLGVKPDEFMAKHGISGTLEDMHSQLGHIGNETKTIVDNLLSGVPGTYRIRATEKILTELRNFFGTVQKGQFVPLPNMSQEFLSSLNEIRKLLITNKKQGLTLTELNRVKRIGDEVFDIFKRSGELKGQRAAKNIANLRKEIREFIELEADKRGISDIRELNKQTQAANSIKREVGDILNVTEVRSAIGDQLIFLMGLTGSAATVNVAPLLGAAAVVGGREIVRLPRIRSFMSTRIRLMTDGEYQTLLRGVETGKKTSAFWRIFKREANLLRKAFPELRLGGIIQEKQERIESNRTGKSLVGRRIGP